MKKYSKQDKKLLATWAVECAERVLDLFEKACPEDDRPRKALETCRNWILTDEFKMATFRKASLAAHAAARETSGNSVACFAARAAGQAVASAHVPQHAFGAAYYALKAIDATESDNAESNTINELKWQLERISENLKEEAHRRVIIEKNSKGISIKIHKDKDF